MVARYQPGLDGLRAVAVTLVFLFHARVPGFGAGFLGVDLFFVLSGFLITDLILTELERSGTIDLGRFLLRRSLRLLPALIAMLLAFVALAPLFPVPPESPVLQALLAFAYVADYGQVLTGLPDELGHTWSLAVEAKFYLVWPIVLMFAARRMKAERLWAFLVLLALVATAWRVGNVRFVAGWDITYYRFDTRLSGLLVGAALAPLLRSGVARPLLARLGWLMALPLAVVLFGPMEWGDKRLLTLGVSLVELATAVMILAVVGRGWMGWLGHPVLAWIGRLSYGIYLWHYPVLRWLRSEVDWPIAASLGFILSLGLAWLSYETVEALARRKRAGSGAVTA